MPGLHEADGGGLGATAEAAAQAARIDLEQQILGAQALDAARARVERQLSVPLRMGQHRPVARRADLEERLFQPGRQRSGGQVDEDIRSARQARHRGGLCQLRQAEAKPQFGTQTDSHTDPGVGDGEVVETFLQFPGALRAVLGSVVRCEHHLVDALIVGATQHVEPHGDAGGAPGRA